MKTRVGLLIVVLVLMLAMPVGARPLADGSVSYTGGNLLSWSPYGSAFSNGCYPVWNGTEAMFEISDVECYMSGGISQRYVWYITSTTWDNYAASISFRVTSPAFTDPYYSCDGGGGSMRTGIAPNYDTNNAIFAAWTTTFDSTVTWSNPAPGSASILPLFLIVDFAQSCAGDQTWINGIYVNWVSGGGSPTATPIVSPTPYPTLPPFTASIDDVGTIGQNTLNAYAPAIGIIFGLMIGLFAIALFAIWIRRSVL